MADRVRVMVFGGDPDRWVRRGMDQVLEWDRVTFHTVEAVFVLGKFGGAPVMRRAKEAAPAHIPKIIVMSPNHIIPELKKNTHFRARIEELEQRSTRGTADAIRQEQETENQGTGTATEKTSDIQASAPEPMTAMGVSVGELWDVYKPQIIESVRSIFKENEKMLEPDFLPVLAEAVGIGEADLKQLLPKLAIKGILVHIGGETWKLLPPVGTEYRYEHDTQELPPATPEPKKQPSRTSELALMVTGLPEGPYVSKYAICSEVLRRKDFTNSEGHRISRSQSERVIVKAIALGAVIQDGEVWRIVHDDGVTLSPPDEGGAPKQTRPKAAKPADAPAETPEPPKQEERPLKISDDVHFLKGAVGPLSLPADKREVVFHARALVAPRHWDASAQHTISKKLRLAGVSPVPLPKNAFSEDEWAALAWETMKAFTFEFVVPILRAEFADETLSCSSCANTFVFEKGEAEFFFNKGLSKPRRCPRCRAEGNDSDRIARRFGE